MATRIEAARPLLKKQPGKKITTRLYAQQPMAKVYSSETAMWTATEAVQIHGGYGLQERIPCGKDDAGCQDHTDI